MDEIIHKLHKHNSVTDAQTDYSLTAEKLLNAVYYTWERQGVDTFTVPITDLKALIGIESDGNNEYLYDCLKELQTVQRFRNFEYKGRGVKLIQSSFITELIIYKDDQNHAKITINPIIVEALKQKAGYTPLELKYVEKFKTIYGLKLWQMFRRYQTLPNKEEVGKLTKTLDELNAYFGSKYEALSQLERSMKRGQQEMFKITGDFIAFEKDTKTKTFVFAWEKPKPKHLESERNFIDYMRKNYVNRDILAIGGKNAGKIELLSVSPDGKLYNKYEGHKDYPASRSKYLWTRLYELAKEDKLPVLSQKVWDL